MKRVQAASQFVYVSIVIEHSQMGIRFVALLDYSL